MLYLDNDSNNFDMFDEEVEMSRAGASKLLPPATNYAPHNTILTPNLYATIISLAREGVPLPTISNLCRIKSPVTIRKWLERGANRKSGIYHDFLLDYNKADAEHKSFMARKWAKIVTEPSVRRVYKEQFAFDGQGNLIMDPVTGAPKILKLLDSETITGDGDWKGISEYLARRDPDNWKKIEAREISGPGGGAIETVNRTISLQVIEKLPLEMKKKLLEIMEAESSQLQLSEGDNGNGNLVIDAEYAELEMETSNAIAPDTPSFNPIFTRRFFQ